MRSQAVSIPGREKPGNAMVLKQVLEHGVVYWVGYEPRGKLLAFLLFL
jgi:hypothetical protein